MNYEIDHCKQCDCGQKRPIVNRTHYLCQEKNHIRLHGETIQTRANRKRSEQIARRKAKGNKVKKPKTKLEGRKNTGIKPSDKTREIEAKYSKTIKLIDQSREMVCDGCGKHQGGEIRLSHSHIISRADCRAIGRLDLIYDEQNIALHCLDFGTHVGCHRKWEGIEKYKLLDFERNMHYIREVDEQLYQRKLNNLKK